MGHQRHYPQSRSWLPFGNPARLSDLENAFQSPNGMAEKLRVLSIRQPYAALVVLGIKDIENRNWRTNVRGQILIQASKTPATEDLQTIGSRYAVTTTPTLRELSGFTGGIIGVVEIVDCVKQSPSKWFVGPYGFVLRGAKLLPFTPYRGPQRWGLPNETILESLTATEGGTPDPLRADEDRFDEAMRACSLQFRATQAP